MQRQIRLRLDTTMDRMTVYHNFGEAVELRLTIDGEPYVQVIATHIETVVAPETITKLDRG
jgi:hypothetical protein